MTMESLLEELLGGPYPFAEFCTTFIKNSQSEEGVRKSFAFLIGLGVKKDRISTQPQILGFKNYIISLMNG